MQVNQPKVSAAKASTEVAQVERALFEAWVRREWPAAPLHQVRDALPVNDPRYGDYCNEMIQRAWVGWQACAASAARATLTAPSPAPVLDDDMVSVPRGLLGSAMHAIRRQVEAPNTLAKLREYAYSRLDTFPAPELERGTVYVEARQCDECQHGGINDSAEGLAACHDCDWTGPDPLEDKCPGCQSENCMTAACPQCGARYVLVASEEMATPVAQPGQVPKWIACADRLPVEEESQFLILLDDGSICVSDYLCDLDAGWFFQKGEATHWLPLPYSPAQGGE